MTIQWPECFLTGNIITNERIVLCKIGLQGWLMAAMTDQLPSLFGDVMVEIGKQLNISPTFKNLRDLYTVLNNEQK